uniref:C-type lectin domain-containing protein n=1 Tax=Anabas testudineus TaxID=64144 RepID=A0AAQ6IPH9_ANATE
PRTDAVVVVSCVCITISCTPTGRSRWPFHFSLVLLEVFSSRGSFSSLLFCEEGWELHGGKCYYSSTRESTWNQSRDYCRRKGGDLVKIDSREEQVENTDRFWIGLTDSKEEGKWLWVDDSPLNTSLTFWIDTQPDNWPGDSPEGEDSDDLNCWYDRFCKDPHKSICEKSAETGRVTRV